MEKKLSIEELNKLIDEIERTNLEYRYVIRDRKKKRIQNEKKRKTRKILSIGVPLSFMGIISLQTLIDTEAINIYEGNNLKISDEKIDELGDRIERRLNIDIDEDRIEEYLLLNAILENLNLTKQEKILIAKEIINIIEINPYLNKERVYQALLKLKVFYMDRPESKSKTTLGECITVNFLFLNINNVYIYSEESKNVLEHELIHILLICLENNDAPFFIKEGLTELLANEFFALNPYVITECYPFETLSVKMLCEIVGPDVILKAYTTGDMNELYDALYNVDPNINAKFFIKELDKVLEDSKKNKKVNKNELTDVIHCWNLYYLNSDIADKETFYYYAYLFESLENNRPHTTYINRIKKNGYVQKTYYNKKINKTTQLKRTRTLNSQN